MPTDQRSFLMGDAAVVGCAQQAADVAAGCVDVLFLAGPALNRRVGDGEFRADMHERRVGVVRLGNGREGEVGDHAGAEGEAVRGTAELEVPEFLPLAT